MPWSLVFCITRLCISLQLSNEYNCEISILISSVFIIVSRSVVLKGMVKELVGGEGGLVDLIYLLTCPSPDLYRFVIIFIDPYLFIE